MSLSLTIARRELRGGLRGFRVFLACLALGVAAIAAVGTLRTGIQQGLADQGAVILGGDAEMRFTYRAADTDERAFMDQIATKVSEVYDFRSMALTRDDQALTQVKAVDDAWPLTGAAQLDPPIAVTDALADHDGLPGALMDPVLIDRLSLKPGDTLPGRALKPGLTVQRLRTKLLLLRLTLIGRSLRIAGLDRAHGLHGAAGQRKTEHENGRAHG